MDFTIQLHDVVQHPWVAGGSKSDLELELPMKQVVETHVIPSEADIDPDVLTNMTSLGCFKDKGKLTRELLNSSHNTEKVIYFLLLDRKRRRPAYEDDSELAGGKGKIEVTPDTPRKRIDKVNLNGSTGRIESMVLAEGSPIAPRRHLGYG